MTTLVYDGTHMVADTQITGLNKSTDLLKIFVHKTKTMLYVFGLSGEVGGFGPAIGWYLNSGDPSKYTFDVVLMVYERKKGEKNGQCLLVETSGLKVAIQPPHADGSGGDWANGAMAAGADAIKAIKIASKFDPYTNERVVAYNCVEQKWTIPPSKESQRDQNAVIKPWLRKKFKGPVTAKSRNAANKRHAYLTINKRVQNK